MPIWLIITATTAYVLGLFVIAWRGDRGGRGDGPGGEAAKPNGLGYALALAVYCTSWTYFGAVGTAASSGWDYIWIYAGPALVFLLFPHVVSRIGDISQRESITSLSDFLSARYGKSRGVAVLATLAAVTGSLPYIALQLKSVGSSFNTLSNHGDNVVELTNETVLLTALTMAAFAIFFGARQSDVTKRNRGLMRVLAFEALIKLAALIAVCILSLRIFDGGISALATDANAHFGNPEISGRGVTMLLLSMAAMICLPRQFHVAMIERRDAREVNWARWVFPLYLLVTSLVVVPITIAGLSIFPSGLSADLFVLKLPMASDHNVLALIVFLGGFSAATGMVIVSTIALSTMVTNDILVPYFIDRGRITGTSGDSGAKLILIRRIVIVCLMLLAYGYYRVAADSAALAQIGLLSFAAAAQFAPGLLGSIYWRRGKKNGVIAGLSMGMFVWGYTLFLPAVLGIDAMQNSLPAFLNPHGLLGINFGDNLTHGVIWSVSANLLAFILGSVISTERLRDRVQAVAFTASGESKIASSAAKGPKVSTISPNGLNALASRFLDGAAVAHSFQRFHEDTGTPASGEGPADWQLVQHTEKLLARAIGASSARVIMSSAIAGVNVDLDDLLTIFDQKSYGERFDQHMLQATLENISHGVSVVDSEQKLVAWNGAYVELFGYPAHLIKVGESIQNLIEYNIRSGWIEGQNPSRQARRRVAHMRAGKPHIYERQNPDGRHLRISGNPMPGGGYVTTFADITEDKRREQALLDANETLEARVEARTKELRALTEDLEKARSEAVGANASKTRFLAAASHDLLQPLNAARLFLGAVNSDPSSQKLLSKADSAIQSADELLKGLLNISRLDHSSVLPKYTNIPLAPLFEDLTDEARPMAKKAGIDIRFAPTRLSVRADPDFLQSIIRNFLSNARRYTQSGGILLGARRHGEQVKIQVWDTGPGISAAQQELIFEEFQRFENVDNLGIRGAGLGLTVSRRMANLMETEIEIKSIVGKGSVFSVCLDRAESSQPRKAYAPKPVMDDLRILTGLTVLCIDDEVTILEGMEALLTKWHCRVLTCTNCEAAFKLISENDVDAVIADYQLSPTENGLDLIANLRPFMKMPDNVCLLTARRTHAVEEASANQNIGLLSKPADPADIQTFLVSCLRNKSNT